MQPQLQPQLHPQLHPPEHPHPPPHPPQPPQPQEHPPFQFPPQLFPPQPQQQNRMMIRTIHRQPFSFPLLKHIVSHLSLGPAVCGGKTLDLRYTMLPVSAGSLTF